tara:strand:- start:13 stop:972 length:960 start_codon:yes stop_codon:yes gene_type:complete
MTQTAIVTGTSSFVGAHLARAFADAGYAVTATHSRPRDSYDGIRAHRLDFAAQSAGLAQLDVTDEAAVGEIVRRVRPTVWVHHAGHAADYASHDYDAAMGRAVNVQPLEAIFAALADNGGGVIITGSSAEYPPSGDANHEDDSGEPETPYGLSKRAETERARALAAQTGVPTRIGRLYIPFGILDHPAKLLAQVIAGLRAGMPVNLSSCTQRRDFIGVADVCDGWLAMARDLGRGGFDIFNICAGEATELRALLLAVAETLGADDRLLRFGARPMRSGEPPISFGDNTKARRMFDWTPRALDAALREDLIQPLMAGALP